MKIWIALAETDSGNEMSYFYSEANAERYAHEFCKARWDEVLGTMPDNWQDAYEMLTADPSYMDWLHMDDLDISGHPAVVEARDELKYMITTGYPSCVDYAADIIVDLGGERLEYEDC